MPTVTRHLRTAAAWPFDALSEVTATIAGLLLDASEALENVAAALDPPAVWTPPDFRDEDYAIAAAHILNADRTFRPVWNEDTGTDIHQAT